MIAQLIIPKMYFPKWKDIFMIIHLLKTIKKKQNNKKKLLNIMLKI